MTATHTSTRPAPHVRLFGRFVVIALFTSSLITTGCDFVDSNAVMDEAPIDETRLLLMSPETFHQVATTEAPCVKTKQGGSFVCLNEDGASTDDPALWSELVGTWQYVEAGVASNKTITFTADQRVRVETGCTTHDGPFSSTRQDQLNIPYLAIIDNRCGLEAEDPLIGMLETATRYKTRGGRLAITDTHYALVLSFSLAKGNTAEGSSKRSPFYNGHVDPPYGTTGGSPDDHNPFVGPPVGIPGASLDDYNPFVGPPVVNDEDAQDATEEG